MPSIEFKSVSKVFPRGGHVALDKVSLQVEDGDIFGIIGRSGAGKSTLLRAINGLEGVSSGEVLVKGVDVSALDRAGLIQLRGQVGMIFQEASLVSTKTIYGNVELPLIANNTPRRERHALIMQVLEIVGLAAKKDYYPAQLSGGQKQRAGIARALVYSPSILLCDEPTSALDPETTFSILKLLKRINTELHKTIVLITHDFSVVKNLCNRVAVMDGGKIVEQDFTWKVFGHAQHQVTQDLLTPFTAAPQDASGSDAAQGRRLFSIKINGQQHISLHELLQLVPPDARIVSSNIATIDARQVGEIILSAADDFLSHPSSLGLTISALDAGLPAT